MARKKKSMDYFVRENDSSPVKGPYSVSELETGICEERITPEFLASSDLGESIAQLSKGRRCDWFSIRQIRELSLQPIDLPVAPTATIVQAKSKNAETISILALASIGPTIESHTMRALFCGLIILALLDRLGVFVRIKATLSKQSG